MVMRTRTKLLLAVCAAAAGLLVLSSLGNGSELEFVAPASERLAVDSPPSGGSLGDMMIRSGPLEDDGGERTGRYDSVCTVTSAPEADDERRMRCAVTLTIGTSNGETELQLAAVGREAADEVVFSIVGGSGEYQGAGGEAVFEYSNPDRTRIRVRLED